MKILFISHFTSLRNTFIFNYNSANILAWQLLILVTHIVQRTLAIVSNNSTLLHKHSGGRCYNHSLQEWPRFYPKAHINFPVSSKSSHVAHLFYKFLLPSPGMWLGLCLYTCWPETQLNSWYSVCSYYCFSLFSTYTPTPVIYILNIYWYILGRFLLIGIGCSLPIAWQLFSIAGQHGIVSLQQKYLPGYIWRMPRALKDWLHLKFVSKPSVCF